MSRNTVSRISFVFGILFSGILALLFWLGTAINWTDPIPSDAIPLYLGFFIGSLLLALINGIIAIIALWGPE